jgi:hypothetical protein
MGAWKSTMAPVASACRQGGSEAPPQHRYAVQAGRSQSGPRVGQGSGHPQRAAQPLSSIRHFVRKNRGAQRTIRPSDRQDHVAGAILGLIAPLPLLPPIAQCGPASPCRCGQRRRAAGPSPVSVQLLRAPWCRCRGDAEGTRAGAARMVALMAAGARRWLIELNAVVAGQ